MRLRYWASFVVFSILLHVALFWPLPAPPPQVGSMNPLIVSLAEIRAVDLPFEPNPIPVKDPSPEQESGAQVKIQNSESQFRIPTSTSAGLRTKGRLSQQPSHEPLDVESKVSTLEISNSLVAKASKEDPSPSISVYRLALAAEVIRKRASIERLVMPEFKGKLVVLVLLHGPDAAPQVSLDEATGSELLDRAVLAVFKSAAETVPVSIAGEVGEVSIRLPVYFDPVVLD